MQQIQNLGDNRNKGWCVFCGGPNETRDHTPSRVFLDKPYPDNLGASPACEKCNNGFSADEAYLACLLECVAAGSVDPSKIGRRKIARFMEGNPDVAARLAAARQTSESGVTFDVEHDRVWNVVVKLARGHAAYELNEPQLDEPLEVIIKPLVLMGAAERHRFERDDQEFALWPEVGSRAMNRLLIAGDDVFEEGWLVVQEGRYRYRTAQDGGMTVRFVIGEYLACEVRWE